LYTDICHGDRLMTAIGFAQNRSIVVEYRCAPRSRRNRKSIVLPC
jgi:hypothetical protein